MRATTQAALDTTGALPLAEASQPGRLISLDVFRGLTVMAMTLVNNPGDWGHIYPPLEHAEWNGCTPTDLIFPFFLFIVGVSLVYALDGVKQRGGRRCFSGWACSRRSTRTSIFQKCASWACCSARGWCFLGAA